MATAKEEAARFDQADQPLEAIAAYESAIEVSEADLDTYINLAVLYFECSDFGYFAAHKLPDSLLNKSVPRARELLDEADKRFGWHAETEFWRKYIAWFYADHEEFYDEALALAETYHTLVPYLHVISGPNGEEYVPQADRLLELVKQGRTEKERLIAGALESALDRLRSSS